MKHALRDSIILLFTYSGIAFLYRAWMKRYGPLVRVIAFHDVEDGAWFEEIIQSLSRDAHVLTPDDFVARKFDSARMNVLVTFDDGYASWVHICAPILKRHGVKALFFVNSGLIVASDGGTGAETFVRENLLLSPKQTIGKEGVITLVTEGHIIGGHTASHTSLRNVPGDTVRHEVESDKQMLETTFGVRLEHFAYPFGTIRDYSHDTDVLIHDVGYPFVYTAEPGFYREGTLHIPRTLIENNQSYASVYRWLMGGYDLFSHLKRVLRS